MGTPRSAKQELLSAVIDLLGRVLCLGRTLVCRPHLLGSKEVSPCVTHRNTKVGGRAHLLLFSTPYQTAALSAAAEKVKLTGSDPHASLRHQWTFSYRSCAQCMESSVHPTMGSDVRRAACIPLLAASAQVSQLKCRSVCG